MPTARVSKVASQKTRLAMLTAVRDKLARSIDTAPAYALPPLILRFQSVLAEIDELGGAAPAVEPVDEVAERRRKRRGTA